MRKILLALEAALHQLSGQVGDSGGPDAVSNYHMIPSDAGIACLSVVVSFVVSRAVPLTPLAILEFSV